jgi:hypothetical protein
VRLFSGIFSSIVIQGAEAKGGGEGTGDVFETHAAGGVTRKGSAISSAKSTYSKSPNSIPSHRTQLGMGFKVELTFCFSYALDMVFNAQI